MVATLGDVDAEWLGETLAGRRALQPRRPFHELCDELVADIEAGRVEPKLVEKQASLVDETRRRYHDELQARARKGDKWAISRLLGKTVEDG